MPSKRILPCLLILLTPITLGLACASCEIDTRVEITDTKNPPTFELSGNGSLIRFIVAGPYSSVEQIDSGGSHVGVVWEIGPSEGKNRTVDRLPKITYGQVPPGFEQHQPVTTPPPPLEVGKFYSIATPSWSANFRTTCFKVETVATVVRVSCRER